MCGRTDGVEQAITYGTAEGQARKRPPKAGVESL